MCRYEIPQVAAGVNSVGNGEFDVSDYLPVTIGRESIAYRLNCKFRLISSRYPINSSIQINPSLFQP